LRRQISRDLTKERKFEQVGLVMSAPSSRIYEYVQRLPHAGVLTTGNAKGESSLDGRPPRTTLYLNIADGRVAEFSFQTSGCGFLIACCGALGDLVIGKCVDECAAIGPDQVEEFLGGLPEERQFCASLAVDALRDALPRSAP
jgi:NifU-like protein involved in Fe-S cluster formation